MNPENLHSLTIDDILEATQGEWTNSAVFPKAIDGISIDSRTISPGQCFIALEGEKHDGHHFLAEAVQKGAHALIVQKPRNGPSPSPNGPTIADVPRIEVPCTSKALENLALFYRARFTFSLVAITGSLGKTTTKELAFQIASRYCPTLKSPKSFNNSIGIPLTFLQIRKEHRVVVLEIGANAFGEIDHLSRIARPDIALITCVAPCHLEGFKNLEGVERAKGEILSGLKREGTLIVNGDDPACLRIASRFSGKVVTFGGDEKCDFHIQKITADGTGSRFWVNGKEFFSSLAGEHNLYNMVAAIAVAEQWDIPYEIVRDGVRDSQASSMRLEVKSLGGITVINDAYNSSPKAVMAAISFLKKFRGKRKIAILGSMLELGEESEKYHHKVGTEVANSGIDILCAVGEEAASFLQGAIEGGMDAPKLFFFPRTEEAMERLPALLEKGDVVLLKASRRMAFERLEESLQTTL